MRNWMMLALISACVGAPAFAYAADDILLFNGRNLRDWTFYLEAKDYNANGKGRIADFATVKPGGIIEINPRLHGALITRKDYLNYRLHAEWRWVDPKARNNTGLFLRVRPPFVWDAEHGEMAGFYQVQLSPGTTGDLWVLGAYSETKLITVPERTFKPFGDLDGNPRMGSIRRHLKSKDAEKPAGEWNSADVTVDGKTISVVINGELVNEGTNIVDLPGRIGLESEFGPVQFRNIRLTPIESKAP